MQGVPNVPDVRTNTNVQEVPGVPDMTRNTAHNIFDAESQTNFFLSS
jgi:hypothetical protein